MDPAEKEKRTSSAAQAPSRAPRWSDMNPDELRKYKDGGAIIPLWVIVAVAVLLIGLVAYFVV